MFLASAAGLSVCFIALCSQLILVADGMAAWAAMFQPPPFTWQSVSKVLPVSVLDMVVSCCMLVSMAIGVESAKRVLRRRPASSAPITGQSPPSVVSVEERTSNRQVDSFTPFE
jgi:hypothetical protein